MRTFYTKTGVMDFGL